MNAAEDPELERFLGFSAEVTAHSVFELRGTGVGSEYLETVRQVVGDEVLVALLDRWDQVRAAAAAGASLIELLRREIFSDPWLGPVARNVVKMWFVGIWYELPRAWTDAYGALERDVTFTVSASAYVEGLVWPDIGAHPPGAKAPGYGSWSAPPRIPALASPTPLREDPR